jgi:hypothetical protein
LEKPHDKQPSGIQIIVDICKGRFQIVILVLKIKQIGGKLKEK